VPDFIGTFWPSWSVAVEEQFYLFWPLLLPLLGRRGVPLFAVGLLVTSWLGRALLVSRFELLVTRGDGLALGCLLAWLLDGQGQPRRRMMARACIPFAAAIGCSYVAWFLTSFYPSYAPFWASAQFTGFSLMFFALIGACVLYSGSFWLSPLRSSLLRWFGTVSYALYLFHLPLLTYPRGILPRFGVHSSSVQNTAIWLLIVLLPGASWYLLEQPILRWKESLLHSPSEANAVVIAASQSA
jgi:peptidoglycan/LPS O-acetylase OafA/YrhL